MQTFHSNRPKIDIEKLEKSMFERFFSFLSILIFIGCIIFLLFMWKEIPDKVPAHYGLSGEVDRWGSKWELLIILFINIFLYIIMHTLGKKPHLHNYPIPITEENVEEAYKISRTMMSVMKNMLLIFFSIVLINSIIVALGWGKGLGIWLLPILIIGTGAPIIWGLIKLFKLK